MWTGKNFRMTFGHSQAELTIPMFSLDDLYAHFKSNTDAWRSYYELASPDSGILPEPYDSSDEMVKLIILKCIRPDKIVPAVRVSCCPV